MKKNTPFLDCQETPSLAESVPEDKDFLCSSRKDFERHCITQSHLPSLRFQLGCVRNGHTGENRETLSAGELKWAHWNMPLLQAQCCRNLQIAKFLFGVNTDGANVCWALVCSSRRDFYCAKDLWGPVYGDVIPFIPGVHTMACGIILIAGGANRKCHTRAFGTIDRSCWNSSSHNLGSPSPFPFLFFSISFPLNPHFHLFSLNKPNMGETLLWNPGQSGGRFSELCLQTESGVGERDPPPVDRCHGRIHSSTTPLPLKLRSKEQTLTTVLSFPLFCCCCFCPHSDCMGTKWRHIHWPQHMATVLVDSQTLKHCHQDRNKMSLKTISQQRTPRFFRGSCQKRRNRAGLGEVCLLKVWKVPHIDTYDANLFAGKWFPCGFEPLKMLEEFWVSLENL